MKHTDENESMIFFAFFYRRLCCNFKFVSIFNVATLEDSPLGEQKKIIYFKVPKERVSFLEKEKKRKEKQNK